MNKQEICSVQKWLPFEKILDNGIIKINNFTIKLFKTLPKFEKYDTIETCNSVKIFSNFYLPIELVKITNSEIVEKQITYGTEEAKQLSVQKACKKIEEKLQDNPEVLQKYVNTNANNDYVEAEVTYEVLENIGTKEKIVFWKDERYGRKKS